MNDDMLNYVKAKLEEGEAISPASLSRIMAAAHQTSSSHARCLPHPNLLSYACCLPRPNLLSYACCLLAASLAIMAGAWLLSTSTPTPDTSREAALANVIDLLRITDGDTTTADSAASVSLADNLLAWQDAPAAVSDDN